MVECVRRSPPSVGRGLGSLNTRVTGFAVLAKSISVRCFQRNVRRLGPGASGMEGSSRAAVEALSKVTEFDAPSLRQEASRYVLNTRAAVKLLLLLILLHRSSPPVVALSFPPSLLSLPFVVATRRVRSW